MRWIYAAAIAVIFARLALLSPPPEPVTAGLAEIVAAEAGVPNSVCGILLRNRLYDTLFELFVFTVAVLGVHYAFSMHEAEDEIFYLHDPTMVILARIGAMVSALIFLELALRGHLAPGGGFAAGVAGGTAIGLLTLSGNAHELHAFYERWHVAALEKSVVLCTLAGGILFLVFSGMRPGGGALNGLVIPALNVLIACKVALGSWAIMLLFIRHRGLL
jgi:multicomponent Na+:H+ antiporter subunit B